MGLFDRGKSPAEAEGFGTAKKVLEQTEALCNCVLRYVDGTTDSEKLIISEVHDKLSNVERLKESLVSGALDPQTCISMGFALTFNQMVELVNKLDASTPEEHELVDLAKQQIAVALKAGYGPAVEMDRQGRLPL